MEYFDIVNIVKSNKDKCGCDFRVKYTGEPSKVRHLFVSSNGVVAEYKKGSRKRGYPLWNTHMIESIKPVNKKVTPPSEFVMKNAKKVVELLNASGLWGDLKKRFESILKLNMNDIDYLLEMHKQWRCSRYEEMQKISKSYSEFFKNKGLEEFDFYHFAQLGCNKQIISIPYDKYDRDWNKKLSVDAIEAAKNCDNKDKVVLLRNTWRGSYDYSIEVSKCKDGIPRAWFSAEYKGCANGHYYLMLDESHALYYEDD